MRLLWTRATVLASAIPLLVCPSLAQTSSLTGEARTGLPGVVRVPMQDFHAPRLAAALDGGYALTEGQSGEGSHHRAIGSLGIGFVPMPWLELGLLSAVRYDWHPNDGGGTDTGVLGQSSLVTRVGSRFGRAFRLGADLGVTFPGSERVVDSLTSPAIDLRALLGWSPVVGIRYGGFAGYRFDRTSGVGKGPSQFRPGDRLVLGLSDFNAVLLGAGIVVPIGKLELLGEVSGDLLVGSKAPPILQSPLRANVGVRHAMTQRLAVELMSECSLSARPDIAPGAPLVPIEARFSVMVGLRYRFWSGVERPTAPAEASPPIRVATKPGVAQAPAPDTGRATVTVFDGDGHPLSDATVTLTANGRAITLAFENGSTYAADSLPSGQARLKVKADLMRDWEQELHIAKDKPVELRVNMIAAESSGQIRGLVRGFDGKGLRAHIHIEPGNRQVRAGPDGAFGVDAAPGKYSVRVFLRGYQSQKRAVEVGKNGIMVLNVDLQKAK